MRTGGGGGGGGEKKGMGEKKEENSQALSCRLCNVDFYNISLSV